MTSVPEVLFVCVHNAGRSQMAAALLDHRANGTVHVRSAGSDPADRLNPAVIEAMSEIGLDITKEFPKPLTDEVVRVRTWSSRWVAVTLVLSTLASATSTGNSKTPLVSPLRASVRFAMRSMTGCNRC